MNLQKLSVLMSKSIFLNLLRDHQQPSGVNVAVPKWHKYAQTILCRHGINIFLMNKVFSL